MPRGGGAGRGPKKNYKGKKRVFTSAEEIQRQNEEEKKQQKSREWREQRGITDEGEEGAKGDDDDSSEESSSEEETKKKGVSHLIEVQNPNRVANKTKKAQDVNTEQKTTLSRREREEIEKQQSTVRYQEMHAQGKTDEAQADLARLSIIRKQREEAAKKREEEKKAKEAASAEAANKRKGGT